MVPPYGEKCKKVTIQNKRTNDICTKFVLLSHWIIPYFAITYLFGKDIFTYVDVGLKQSNAFIYVYSRPETCRYSDGHTSN